MSMVRAKHGINALLTTCFVVNCQFLLAAPRDVQFKSIDFETSVVEVHNFGDTAQSITNWRFCSHDDNELRRYSNPGALNSITLDSEESLFVHFANDAPAGSANALNISSLGFFATPLDQGPFSINLYTNSVFTNPASMVDHVQWSVDGLDNTIADERSSVAEAANLWTNDSEWISTTESSQRIELILNGSDAPPSEPHGPSNYLVVEPTPSSPADLDGDGDVDGEDLAAWEGAFGSTTAGDIDSDGDTDGKDFLIWQREFTGPVANLHAVPEPATGLIMAVGLLVPHPWCRRRYFHHH